MRGSHLVTAVLIPGRTLALALGNVLEPPSKFSLWKWGRQRLAVEAWWATRVEGGQMSLLRERDKARQEGSAQSRILLGL